MTEENTNSDKELEAQESKERKEAEEQFNKEAVTPSALTVKTPETKEHKSFMEKEEEQGNEGDLAITLRTLFPKFPYPLLNRVCSPIMVGRVSHDTKIECMRLTVMDIVQQWEEHQDEADYGRIDVQLIIDLVRVAYEIGTESEGRMDVVKIYGANETKELEKMANYIEGGS